MSALQAVVAPIPKSPTLVPATGPPHARLVTSPPKEKHFEEAKLGEFTYVKRNFDLTNLKVTSAPTNVPSDLTVKEVHAYGSKMKDPVVAKAWVYKNAIKTGAGNLISLLNTDAQEACYNYYYIGKEASEDEKNLPNLQLGDAMKHFGLFARLPSEIHSRILGFVVDVELQEKTYLNCKIKFRHSGQHREIYTEAEASVGIGIPRSLLNFRLGCRYSYTAVIGHMMRQFAFTFSRPEMLDKFVTIFDPKFVLLQKPLRTFQTIIIDARMEHSGCPTKTSFVSLGRSHGIGELPKSNNEAEWNNFMSRVQFFSLLLPIVEGLLPETCADGARALDHNNLTVPAGAPKIELENWVEPLDKLLEKFSVDKLVFRHDPEVLCSTSSSHNSPATCATSLLAQRDLPKTLTVYRQVGGWDRLEAGNQHS